MKYPQIQHLVAVGRVRQHSKILIASFLALSATTWAFGASIGLKLGINSNGGLQSTATGALAPTDVAGAMPYQQANWNVLGRWGNSAGSFDILDSAGNVSGVIVHWDATGIWSQSGGGTPTDQGNPDGNLMNAYCDSNGGIQVPLTNNTSLYTQNGGNKPILYVSGLSAWLAAQGASYYDVVVYSDGDAQSSRTGEFWIMEASGDPGNITFGQDLTTHAYISDRANFVNTMTYTEVPLIASRPWDAWAGNFLGNYVVFNSMNADSFVLRADEVRFPGGTLRSPINAVQIVPRATPQPASIAPLAPAQTLPGGTARFYARVGGRAPTGYQWLKNGVPLSDGGNVAGANTPNLVLSGVSAADVGNYALVVTNAIGVVTSAPAALSLVSPAANTYARKVADTGPYAYWRLNDLSDPSTNGPALDVAGGFNGTYGSTALNGQMGVTGPLPPVFPGFETGNTALQSVNNQFASWVTCPPLNLSNNTVTITAWIYPTGNEPAYTGIVFSRNGGDTSGLGIGNTANYLGYNWNNQSAAYSFQSGLAVPSNQWSFVALVVTPTNAVLYLYNTNGQFSATNTMAHAVAGFSGPTFIGVDPNNVNRSFNGVIDEAAVFNRALSPFEILDLYKSGLGLTVIPPTVTEPRSMALLEGRPARFSVIASGDPPLSYQWRKNGANLTDGGSLTGANSPTLTINPVAMADAGAYDVVVANLAGSITSTVANLTVVVSNASPTAYEAVLRALNPLAYWRFNEVSGNEAYDYWGGTIATHVNPALGATGPQPTDFAGLEADNAAVGYDGFSSYTDTGVSLINNRAQFSIVGWFNSAADQPARTGLFGQNDVAEFGFHGINAPGTTADLAIWTPNGGSASFATLGQSIITAGQWYFVAGVGDGSRLTVYLFAPDGTVRQTSASVTTTNYGSSAYPFRIGGGGILDATGNHFIGQIDEVAVFDRALSMSELASLYGAAKTGGALPPSIAIEPTSQTLYAGLTATLSVSAVGSTPLTYQWRKNGQPLADSGNVTGATTDTLLITNLATANAGDYDVVVANVMGRATSVVAKLTVIQPAPGTHEAVVVAANPLAYYRFNELTDPSAGDAVVNDFCGGHNGLYGTASLNGFNGVAGPRPADGLSLFEAANTALQSTGVANSWATVSPPGITTDTLTLTAWIKPASYVNRAGIVFARAGQPATGLNFIGTGNLNYHWLDTAATYNWDSGLTVPTNQWSFVALVVEPTQATMYLCNANGVQSAVNATTHAARAFTDNIRIGGDPNSDARTFDGVIDEVAIFNRALTPTEILTLYQGFAPVSLDIRKVGNDVVLTWPAGVLLEADQLTGPWTTNNAASPYTITAPTGQKFYRVIVK